MSQTFLDWIGAKTLKCRINYNHPSNLWVCERDIGDIKIVLVFAALALLVKIVAYTAVFPRLTRRIPVSLKERLKAHDELWFMLAHLLTFVYGAVVLYTEPHFNVIFGSRKVMKLFWRSHPAHSTFLRPQTQLFYLFSCGIWLFNFLDLIIEKTFGFKYLFVLSKIIGIPTNKNNSEYCIGHSIRKSFLPMILHHAATMFLLVFSYMQGYTKIGHFTLLCADIADVLLNFTKVQFNIMSRRMADFGFLLFTIAWIYTRHYLMFNMFMSIAYDSLEELERDCRSWDTIGGLCNNGVMAYTFCFVFFGTLQVLFVYWMSLIAKTIYISAKVGTTDITADPEPLPDEQKVTKKFKGKLTQEEKMLLRNSRDEEWAPDLNLELKRSDSVLST